MAICLLPWFGNNNRRDSVSIAGLLHLLAVFNSEEIDSSGSLLTLIWMLTLLFLSVNCVYNIFRIGINAFLLVDSGGGISR